MEKLNLNKLIANDIVNYGMDKTTSFNYIVSLNDFLDDYDEESIGIKIVREYGRTQYVGHFDYEFGSNDVMGGIDIKILF